MCVCACVSVNVVTLCQVQSVLDWMIICTFKSHLHYFIVSLIVGTSEVDCLESLISEITRDYSLTIVVFLKFLQYAGSDFNSWKLPTILAVQLSTVKYFRIKLLLLVIACCKCYTCVNWSIINQFNQSSINWLTYIFPLRVVLQRAQCEQSVLKVNMIRADLQWRLVQLRLQKDALEKAQISSLQKGKLLN